MDFVDINYYKDPMMDMTQVSIKFKEIHVPVANSYLATVPNNEYIAHDVANKVSKMVGEEIYRKIMEHLDATANEKPAPKTSMNFEDYIVTHKHNSANTYSKVTWDDVEKYKQLYFNTPTTTTSTSGYGTGSSILKQLRQVFGDIFSELVSCPSCEGSYIISLGEMIQHLNDSPHNWSRESIADWIETLDIDINAKEVDNDD